MLNTTQWGEHGTRKGCYWVFCMGGLSCVRQEGVPGFRMLQDHWLQETLGAFLLSYIDVEVFLTQAL